jgi:hypothetical protein
MTQKAILDPAAVERVMVSDPRDGFANWFSAYARIKDKRGKIVQPILNPMQQEICDAIGWCLTNNRPIRLVILKPRQVGLSTIIVAALYWFMLTRSIEGCVIGGQDDQVKSLWEYFKRYASTDLMNWGISKDVQAEKAVFSNGSRCLHETAGDPEAGRGNAFHFVLCTEAARWREGGVCDADQVLAGILSCVPMLPETCVVLESTARGPTGPFYEYYQSAVSLEEAKAGEWADSGFIKIFSPWYVHDQHRELHPIPEQERHIETTYTADERDMVQRFNLESSQIRWYRSAFHQIAKKEPATMKREFPATEEEAFHSTSNQRFNSVGLAHFRQQSVLAHPEFGLLEGQNNRYAFIPTEESYAKFVLYEQPVAPLRYLIAVDTMTARYTNPDDMDCHSALVIRSGYMDEFTHAWKPPKVVCRLAYKCRLDIDLLTEDIWRMSQFYGNCKIIPEANQERGLIAGLLKKGADVYEQMTTDRKGNARKEKSTGMYGIQTTGGQAGTGSRNRMIEMLATAIREYNTPMDGLEILDRPLVQELEDFIVHPSGKAEAAPGKHDDDVMALAIGITFIGLATPYVAQVIKKELPRDLQLLEQDLNQQDKRGGQWN